LIPEVAQACGVSLACTFAFRKNPTPKKTLALNENEDESPWVFEYGFEGVWNGGLLIVVPQNRHITASKVIFELIEGFKAMEVLRNTLGGDALILSRALFYPFFDSSKTSTDWRLSGNDLMLGNTLLLTFGQPRELAPLFEDEEDELDYFGTFRPVSPLTSSVSTPCAEPRV